MLEGQRERRSIRRRVKEGERKSGGIWVSQRGTVGDKWKEMEREVDRERGCVG